MRDAITLTRRGWSIVGATLGLGLGGYLLGVVEMLVLAVAALTLLAGSVTALAFRRPLEVDTHRRVRPDRLHVGADGRVELTVTNRSAWSSDVLLGTDEFDDGRSSARFLVPALTPGGTARAAYRIPTRRRGRYTVGPLEFVGTDPFGLVERVYATLGTAELIVRPRVHPIITPAVTGGAATVEDVATTAPAIASDLGHEFLTLREYEVGDDLRRVHWRSSARVGELMIRRDEARWRSRIVVILDTRPAAHDHESFEVAVEVVASVASQLAGTHRRVEVVTSAGHSLGTGDARLGVLDQLATVSVDPDDRLAAVLTTVRAQRRPDLVVAVLGAVDPQIRRALVALAGITTIAVTTQPTDLVTGRALVVVDTSAVPFAPAWNHAVASAIGPHSPTRRWPRATASSPR